MEAIPILIFLFFNDLAKVPGTFFLLRKIFMKRLLVSSFLLAAVLFSKSINAATFNVTDSAGFAAALSTASSNGEDNTINVAGGTYSSASGFSYSATNHSLTIVGAGQSSTFMTASAGDALSLTYAGTVTVSGITFQSSSGSGILVESEIGSALNLEVSACRFLGNNNSGMRIHNNAVEEIGSIHIHDNLFQNNKTNDAGGGLFISGEGDFGTAVQVNDNVFDHNTSNVYPSFPSGGGAGVWIFMFAENSPLTFTGNIFQNNSSVNDGGAAFLYTRSPHSLVTIGGSEEGEENLFTGNNGLSSGGIYISSASGATFMGNTLIGNSCTGEGGAVRIVYDGGHVEFSNNIIQNNVALYKGGFSIGASALNHPPVTFNMNANLISGNRSTDDGGGALALVALSDTATITNNVFVENIGDTSSASVGGLDISSQANQEIDVINNTFAYNSSEGFGGGLMIVPGDTTFTMSVNVYNNLFWENSSGFGGFGPDTYVYGGVSPILWAGMTFNNNDATGVCVNDGTESCNTGDDFSAIVDTSASANLYNIDPQFFGRGNILDYYSLQSDSPVIQQGSAGAPSLPEFDYTGTVPMDTPPDLGALQYCVPSLSVAITSSSDPVILGDNITWTITLSNSANCASNDNTLNLSFTSSELVSAVQASSSAVTCSGSGSSATCILSQIAANSSVSLSAVSSASSLGSVSLNASLSNSLETASASGSGSVTVVSPSPLSGAGCELNKSTSENHLSLWMMGFVLLLLARRRFFRF